MRSLLIFPAVLVEHSDAAEPNVSGPTDADIILQHSIARSAQRPQIGIARQNNSLAHRQRFPPWRPPRDRANALGQCPISKRSATRIETREFAKLHRGAAHDKTPARIRPPLFPGRRRLSQM